MRPTVFHTTLGSWQVASAAVLCALVMGCGSGNSASVPADHNTPSATPPSSYNPFEAVQTGRWDNDPPLRTFDTDLGRTGAGQRQQTAPVVLAARPWKAAILTCSAEEVTAANYLKQKSAVAYPNVTITIVNVPGVTPDAGVASGDISASDLVTKVGAALAPFETSGKFQMLQLMHQFPHHVSWPPAQPTCLPGLEPKWSPESVLMCGADATTLADSPPSFNPYPHSPWAVWYGAWTGNNNWRMIYMVTRLEGRTLDQVKAKIDLACAPSGATRSGVVIDGPGKAGPANNNPGGQSNIDTYWEHMWETDALFNVAGIGTKYGFPVKNDMAGYHGDTNNNNDDDAGEMPAAAYAYQTTSTFPVAYLVCFERHSNGDGRFGPAWTGPSIYTNLQFAPRSVVAAMESFTGYSIAGQSGYGNLGAWLDLPVAGVIAFKNEPCLTGIYHDSFSEGYVGKNGTFGESAMSSFQFLKTIDTAFGVCWMTLR
ncbi:MAG: hypothetical protein ABI743_05095 [bacterium]